MAIPLLALFLCGCSEFQTEVNKEYVEKGDWVSGEPRAYTTADVRLIARRNHPVTNQPVVCTEPTPDVAKALSAATQLSLQGGNAGASGQVGFAGGSAEALAELAGRSTALIALRDGLYRACEAYANGAIGSDAYTLVLSRYGQLMTTLFLGEDIRGAAAVSGASAQSPALITINPAGGGQSQPQTQTPDTPPAGGKKKSPPAPTQSSYLTDSETGLMRVADWTSPAGDPAAAAAGAGGAAGKKPKSNPNANPNTQTNTPPQNNSGSQNPSPGTSAIAAVALVRLEEDFRDLDVDFLNQLIVACVNEYDSTRKRRPDAVVDTAQYPVSPPPVTALPGDLLKQDPMLALLSGLPNSPASLGTIPGQNAWLRQVCPSLASAKVLLAAQGVLLQTLTTVGHPAADVKPDAGLAPPPGSSPAGK
jgi:hypothetical protein